VGEIVIKKIRINQIAIDLKHRELKQHSEQHPAIGLLQDVC
jgi:hypothetical protein